MNTDSDLSEELDRLVSKMLDHSLSTNERARLNLLLRESEHARRIYHELLDNHEAFSIIYPGDIFETALELEHASANPEPSAALPAKPANAIIRSWGFAVAVAVAAVAVLLFVLVPAKIDSPHAADSSNETSDTVARLIATVDTDWSSVSPAPGSSLSIRDYTLTRGIAEIEFHDGARVSLRGPASFELRSAGHLHLRSGRLVARIPDDALGFTVTTPQNEVVDLGTEFGLDVAENGSTDVHVIDGLVQIHSLNQPSGADSRPGYLISEGQARRFPSEFSFRSEDIPVSTRDQLLDYRHDARWGLSLLRGNVRLNDNSSTYDLSKTAHTQPHIEVIPERMGIRLAADAPVTFAVPGYYRNFASTGQRVSAGTRVDSYLLHFRSIEGGPIRGVIKFDQPILGVICEEHHLIATDPLTGNQGVTYPSATGGFRGLEPNSRQEFDTRPKPQWFGNSPDEVTLSQDLRTLGLRVNVVPDQGVDQLRVLVQSKE